MVLEEATIAQHRADAAVQMQEAVNRLCLAMLKHQSLDTVRATKIQAMLRKQDSLDDIESMTAELETVEEQPAPKVTGETPVPTPSPPPPAPVPPPGAGEVPAEANIEVKKEETEELDGESLKTEEELAAAEAAEKKEAKRLAHNSYVRYKNSLRNPTSIDAAISRACKLPKPCPKSILLSIAFQTRQQQLPAGDLFEGLPPEWKVQWHGSLKFRSCYVSCIMCRVWGRKSSGIYPGLVDS